MAEKQQKKIPTLPVLSYAVRLFMLAGKSGNVPLSLQYFPRQPDSGDREKSAKLNKNRKNCKGEKNRNSDYRLGFRIIIHVFFFFSFNLFFLALCKRQAKENSHNAFLSL